MDLTSRTLLLRLKECGPEREIAWSEFRRRYVPVITAFARRTGAAVCDVEDVVQEVLTGFYSAQPTFVYDPQRGRLRGYLKTCVIHLLARRARVRARLRIDGRSLDELDPADDRIEAAWATSWANEHLHRAIELVRQQLDDGPGFHAFYRITIGQEDPAAVAEKLSMSLAAVYKAKSRCVARLRATLDMMRDEEG